MPDVPIRRTRLRERLARHGWLIAIVAAYLYVFPYFPRIHSANELPRVYLVKAIVEDGTFAIDRQVARWGATADVSPSGNHSYSNKAPGSSLIVVPVYAAVTWIAGPPGLGATLWMCRVIAGVIPMALFLWLLWGFLERYAPDVAVRRLVLVAYALGSMVMTYSILFYSHQLGAICIASAWILAVDVAERRRGLVAMAAAGFLAGAAPLVDYQAVFPVVPVGVYVLAKLVRTCSRRELVRYLTVAVIAAAIPIAALLAYHAACFGSPWRTGYDASQSFAHFHQHGFLGMTRPHWDAFFGSLVPPDNGLFALSPWLLLAIPGGVALWRRERGTVVIAAVVTAMFLWFVSSINFWRGGWGVGPRYITAMLPFLLPLVASALSTYRRWYVLGLAGGLVAVGVVIYMLTAATMPYWPDSLRDPLYEVTFRLLGENAVAPNLGRAVGVPGLAGVAPFLLGIAALAGWSILRVAGRRGLALACAVALAVLGAYGLVPHGGDAADRAYERTLYPAVTSPL